MKVYTQKIEALVARDKQGPAPQCHVPALNGDMCIISAMNGSNTWVLKNGKWRDSTGEEHNIAYMHHRESRSIPIKWEAGYDLSEKELIQRIGRVCMPDMYDLIDYLDRAEPRADVALCLAKRIMKELSPTLGR